MYAKILGACASGLFVLAIQCAMFGACAGDPSSDEDSSRAIAKKGSVRLMLSKASAKQEEDFIAFACEAVLVNKTGAIVNVRSNFFSAFDGLELVVFGPDGSKLVQQPYIFHQSPHHYEGRLFPLKIDENRQTLQFPVWQVPNDVNKVRVLLIGTLPGDKYGSVLCSNIVTISIRGKKGDHR